MIRFSGWLVCVALVAALAFVACEQKPHDAPRSETKQKSSASSESSTNVQTFSVKGVIQEIKPDGKTAKIKHEAIPNYMAAMTMDFEARNTNELRGLKAGDVISFRLSVTSNDGWIDQVKKLSATSPTELPSRQSVHVTKDVDLLKPGDLLPEYHFTNELGQAVSFGEFKGQALAITFIFTSCPYPVFCPRMSQNFVAAQKKMASMPNAPSNWRLLTISFDPEKDTPEVLKAYAERYEYDPKHWSFLTGDLTEITAVAEQCGLMFWREGGTINHNLRTAIVDAKGRVQKIITGNEWKSDEIVEELMKAAEVK